MTSVFTERPPTESETEEPSEPVEETPRFPWLSVVGLILIGLVVFVACRWGEPLLAAVRDQDQVREWLAGFGFAAPVISIVLNTLQVLLAPIPGQVIGLANGYLFGVFWGTVYSLIGVMLGTAIAMLLGRLLGRPVVERFVSAEHLHRWDDLANRRGPVLLFLVFLLPLLPDDVVAFAVGLSPLSIPYALVLAAIGRLPGLIVSSWIGANATSLSPVEWAIVAFGTLVLAAVVLRYRSRLEAAILGLADRWSERFRGSDGAE